MRAIRVTQFGGEEVLKVQQVPAPSIVRPSQVLVRLRAAGVNPVETYIRTGTYAVKPELPYTPGKDGAGEVEAVGAEVTRFRVGQRVWLSAVGAGTYAERCVCEEAHVHELPERVSFAQGAALGVPYCTAYAALLLRGRALAGETVLVHGASGGVGVAATQLARAAGMRVIGTAGSEEGMRLVKEQGAHLALNHSQEGYLKEAQGVDVIIEMLANVNLAKDLQQVGLNKNARIVVVGNRGEVTINPRDLMRYNASITGMLLYNTSEDEMRQVYAGINAGLESGTLTPLVDPERQFPLEEAPQAHRDVIHSKSNGKIILLC